MEYVLIFTNKGDVFNIEEYFQWFKGFSLKEEYRGTQVLGILPIYIFSDVRIGSIS
jgi:hypothetical protein